MEVCWLGISLLSAVISRQHTRHSYKMRNYPSHIGTNALKPCLKPIFMHLSFDVSLPHPAVPFSWPVSAFFSLSNTTSLENDRWSYTRKKKGQSFDHRDLSTLLTEQNGPWKIFFFSSAEVLIYLSFSSQVDLNSFLCCAGFGWDGVNFLENS